MTNPQPLASRADDPAYVIKRLEQQIQSMGQQLEEALAANKELNARLDAQNVSEQKAGWAIDRALQIRATEGLSVDGVVQDAKALCDWIKQYRADAEPKPTVN